MRAGNDDLDGSQNRRRAVLRKQRLAELGATRDYSSGRHSRARTIHTRCRSRLGGGVSVGGEHSPAWGKQRAPDGWLISTACRCAGAARGHDQAGGESLDCSRQAVCEPRRGRSLCSVRRHRAYDRVGDKAVAGAERSAAAKRARSPSSGRRCRRWPVPASDEDQARRRVSDRLRGSASVDLGRLRRGGQRPGLPRASRRRNGERRHTALAVPSGISRWRGTGARRSRAAVPQIAWFAPSRSTSHPCSRR